MAAAPVARAAAGNCAGWRPCTSLLTSTQRSWLRKRIFRTRSRLDQEVAVSSCPNQKEEMGEASTLPVATAEEAGRDDAGEEEDEWAEYWDEDKQIPPNSLRPLLTR